MCNRQKKKQTNIPSRKKEEKRQRRRRGWLDARGRAASQRPCLFAVVGGVLSGPWFSVVDVKFDEPWSV